MSLGANRQEDIELSSVAKLLALFAIACLCSAFFVGCLGGRWEPYTINASGGQIGPIETHGPGQVLEIRVQHHLGRDNVWAFVTGELLDAEKEYLFSFGEELWRETGRDSDGAWRESKTDYDLKITIPEPGTYWLAFDTESSPTIGQGKGAQLYVELRRRRGSAVPFVAAGILALLAAFLVFEFASNARITTAVLSSLSEG